MESAVRVTSAGPQYSSPPADSLVGRAHHARRIQSIGGAGIHARRDRFELGMIHSIHSVARCRCPAPVLAVLFPVSIIYSRVRANAAGSCAGACPDPGQPLPAWPMHPSLAQRELFRRPSGPSGSVLRLGSLWAARVWVSCPGVRGSTRLSAVCGLACPARRRACDVPVGFVCPHSGADSGGPSLLQPKNLTQSD